MTSQKQFYQDPLLNKYKDFFDKYRKQKTPQSNYTEYVKQQTKSREEIIQEIMKLTKMLEPRGKQTKRNDYVNDVKQSQYNYLKQLNQYTS